MIQKKLLVALLFSTAAIAQDGKVTCDVTSTTKPDEDLSKTLTWDFKPGPAKATMLKSQSADLGNLKISIRMLNEYGEPHYAVTIRDTKQIEAGNSLSGDPSFQVDHPKIVKSAAGKLYDNDLKAAVDSKPIEYSDESHTVWISCKFKPNTDAAVNSNERKVLPPAVQPYVAPQDNTQVERARPIIERP